MANLDTTSKRRSSVGMMSFSTLAPPLPDGAIDQGDRQHIAVSYSGIAAGAAVPDVAPTFMSELPLDPIHHHNAREVLTPGTHVPQPYTPGRMRFQGEAPCSSSRSGRSRRGSPWLPLRLLLTRRPSMRWSG